MTGEDLGYKPDAIMQAKFEYSPLGKVFNKGLDKKIEKKEFFKKLKNIEDTTKNRLDDEQLDAIKKQVKEGSISVREQRNN